MKDVLLVDIYNKDGEMQRIEAFDSKGDFIFQAMWDPNDEQTSEKREAFRKWAKTMAQRLGYTPAE